MQCTVSGVAGGAPIAALWMFRSRGASGRRHRQWLRGSLDPSDGNLNPTVSVDVNVPAPNETAERDQLPVFTLASCVDILSGGTWMNPVHTVGSY